MNTLSDEERDLLNSDPELVALRQALQSERDAVIKAEEVEHSRQCKLDEEMQASYDLLISKKRIHNDWKETWKTFTEEEALLLSKMRNVCEKLLFVEDEEEEKREAVEMAFRNSLAAVKKFQIEKRQLLIDSSTWQHQFNATYEAGWAIERALVREGRDAFVAAKTQAELDEEEIAALKARVGRLRQSASSHSV